MQRQFQIEIIYVADPDKVKSDVLSNWNSGEIGDIRKKRVEEADSKIRDTL